MPGMDEALPGSDESGDPGANDVDPADDDDDDDDAAETGGMSGDGDDDDDDDETGDDDDDAAETGGTADDDDDDDDPPPTCEELGNTCAPDFPSSWFGPYALVEHPVDGSEPSCPPSFPDLLTIEVYDDLIAPPAECECSCGEPVGASCDGGLLEVSWTTFESGFPLTQPCAWPANDTATLDETGTYVAAVPGPRGWLAEILEAPEVDAGGCAALTEENVPEAQFATRVALCAGEPSEADCEGSEAECWPAPEVPATESLCVYRLGDHECPDAYPQRRVAYESFDDTRACNDCSCGSAEGTCEAQVLLFDGPVVVADLPVDGSCTSTTSDVSAVVYAQEPAVAACEPSEPEPVGAAEGSSPVTICCAG